MWVMTSHSGVGTWTRHYPTVGADANRGLTDVTPAGVGSGVSRDLR